VDEDDAKKFKMKADKLVEQYNNFTVLDTLHLNGKLPLVKILATSADSTWLYTAFKKTPQGNRTRKLMALRQDQRFFLSWAQIWRSNSLPETAAQLVLVDPHSPGEFRTNGIVVHLDAFYKAFDVKEGDKMYLPEDKRIRIW
jgi:putative endopeptidase